MKEITSIETARGNYEAAKAELNALQAESSALPTATAKALEALDTTEAERLRRRRVELPSYIDVARVKVVQNRQAFLKAQERVTEESVAELKEKFHKAGNTRDQDVERANEILRTAQFALEQAQWGWENEEAKLQMIRAHLVGSERELQQLLSGQAAKAA
jgi:membrane-bound lytic murein transglycosylase